jgi:PAS domain S-box-containing protein
MSQTSSQFLVAGIGASAGGVEALQEFFAHVRPASGCAYVVILHLSPEYESNLVAILQTVTPMPVIAVTEAARVEPDHVYVVPPSQHLTMVDGAVHVSPNLAPEERRAPIDIFFRTLADSHTARSVCVILSGSGSDGSMGLKRVKERGGAVFVQNPREAEFAEMPRSAIATDLVDEVLPVAQIPARIVAYQASPGTVAISEQPKERPEEQQQALREVFTLLRTRTGHDFADYKRGTVLRRIERRITVRNLPNLGAYAAFLRDHPDEVQSLLKDLLISVTNFFRDREAFQALEQDILPRIFASKQAGEQVRVWVVGCATGEEAYSIAMLCAERTFDVLDGPSVQVFATDIDEAVIAHARQGLYTLSDLADVSPERLRRFFATEDGRYRVRPELRETVLFAHHNILKDPPFSHIDLVTCRNVLIYLNQTAQERVLETLHFALNPAGYLFLGTAESVDGAGELFATLSREHHIYQHRVVGARPLPLPEGVPPLHVPPPRVTRLVMEAEERPGPRISASDLHQRLLEQYAPPSIVVTPDFDVVHVSDRAGRYLQIAGKPSRDLLRLVRPELRGELHMALSQAVRQQASVNTSPLPIRIADHTELVTIQVRPVLRDDDPAQGYLLVLFEAGARAPSDAEVVVRSDERATRQLDEEVTRLRLQLRGSSEQYEYQTEELRATNEELQATNEELRSSSEELETSKEELQSINEELRTVNQELKVKVEEATLHSTNLQNLVNSAGVATIFLDRTLRIKLFTPAARALFNLIAADYGRPLSDITHRLVDTHVLADAEHVLASLQPVEREVRATTGGVYVLRVLPYRMGEDRIGGVVLTFFDITERMRAEAVLRASEQRQAFLLALSDALRDLSDPIAVQATASRVLGEHLGSDRAYYVEIDEARGEYVVARDWHRPGAPSHARRYPLADWPMPWLVDGKTWVVRDVDTDPAMPDEQRAAYRGNDIGAAIVVPLIKGGRLVATLVTNQRAPRSWTVEEVSLVEETAERTWAAVERARAEERLRVSEQKYRAMFESIGEGISILEVLFDEAGERAIDYRFVENNPAVERMTGVADSTGKTVLELFPNFDKQRIESAGEVVRTGQSSRFQHFVPEIGRWFDVHEARVGDAGDRTVIATFTDITERKRHESNLAFLADLGEDFSRLSTADEIMQTAGEKLGAFLKIQKCNIALIDEERDEVRYTDRWNSPDVAPLPDMVRLSAYVTDDFLMLVRARATVVSTDTATDARMKGEENAKVGAGAFITVPFHQHGEWKYLFSVTDVAPRQWRADEIELVQELANRLVPRLERARTEEALRESEARFRTLADTVPQVIWANEAGGRATYFNQRWYEYSGLSYEQSAGPGWQAIVHPDDAPASRERWQRALDQGAVFDTEYRLRRADGSYRWHLGRNVPLRDNEGHITGWFGSATDIEDLKQAEAALQASEERLRLVIESVQEYAIVTLDPAGRISSWNSGAEQIFGYAPDEVLGRDVELLFTPEDRAAQVSAREQQAALTEGRAADERWHLRKDGTRFYADSVLSPVRDAAGRLRWFVKVARDLTAKQQAAAELQAARDALELHVAERTAELAKANSVLQQEIRERIGLERARALLMEQLVTAQEDERRRIARDLHDSFGQFLSALSIQLRVAQDVPDIPDGMRAAIGRVRSLAAHLDAELDRLMNELRPPALDQLGLVDALQSYVAAWTTTSAVPVDLYASGLAEPRLPPVVESTLYRIVQEALTNVLKYANASQVSIVLERLDGDVRVIIEDDGVGFDPGAVIQQGGRRMGLVGMRERATLAGGTLRIESAPGQGTSIYVRLPLRGALADAEGGARKC